ncbi:hypothetical protein JCM9492_11010 [Aquifex pyrophilus]
MAFREELILEIKAQISQLNEAVSEIKQRLERAFNVDLSEVKKDIKTIASSAQKAGESLQFDDAKKDLREIKNEVKEIERTSRTLRKSPFRKWLEDLTFASELIENLETVWRLISATSPFTRGFRKLSELETSLFKIAGILHSAGASAEVLKERLSELEKKKLELELRGNARRELEKIEKEIQKIEGELKNLADAPSDFAKALETAKEVQEALRKEAFKSVATYEHLYIVFTNIAQSALSAGLSIQQTVELSRLLVETAYALGYRLDEDIQQVAQQARALLSGQKSELSEILGISEKVVQQWRLKGTLYENITQSLQGIAQAGEKVQGTFFGIVQTAKEIYDYFSQIASRPLFEAVKKDLQALKEYLFQVKEGGIQAGQSLSQVANPQVVQAFKTLGIVAREVYESLKAIGAGAREAISDVSRIFSPLISALRKFYQEHETLIKGVLKLVGYIGTIALVLLPLGRILSLIRLIVFAFARLRVLALGVIELFKGGASITQVFASWSSAVSQLVAWFARLGIIARAVVISAFLKLAEVVSAVFDFIKEKILGAIRAVVDFISGIFAKIKELLGLKEEKIKVEADTQKALNDIQKLREALKNTSTEIKVKGDTSDALQKIQKLASTEARKELKLVAETSEVESAIFDLESKEIVIPVRFVPVKGDYTPGWEEL